MWQDIDGNGGFLVDKSMKIKFRENGGGLLDFIGANISL